ncbi:Ig-like domain-containing protein [Methanobrevibacter sp.]|uniref:Ig-like domain-containing protein n=1 Tax=Methanobrevibacter sp. TaxID=66852 RepID=UPI0025DC9DC4|nr:Ig-like domain-containing protein [Methanobrevibacter sp.]MBR4447252.1 Ig-like domain-containing protein [Methanobrevibacter sp.]
MNIKLNTTWFIFLLFLLIGVASATDTDNETLQQTIEQSDDKICQESFENQDCLEASNIDTDKIESPANQAVKNSKAKVKIKSNDVKMYYKDGSKFTVTLKNQQNQAMKNFKVKIAINGKTYVKTTDSKGKASLNLKLNSGKYSVVTTFEETKLYKKQSVKNTVTIKSTIKCGDLSKYYKNEAAYSSTFYDKKGKVLENTNVKFKLNGKTYYVKTNKKGVGKLAVNLNPGKYSISSINSKTSESITKAITIQSILETKDLTMNEKDGSKFTVKVLNSNGKVSPNKKITLKINGETYTPKSNSNGIATQIIDLPAGKYTITTEYEGLKNTNQIIVKNVAVENPVKKSEFTHSIIIPNYVNVTIPYAFHNSAYTLKTGANGTVKMPKVEVFTVEIGTSVEQFATGKTNVEDAVILEEKSYFIPFQGYGIRACVNKESLKGNGIIITRTPTYTQIDYRDTTNDNTELIGFYADKGMENSETFTYLKNDKIIAKINVQTQYYDETGVKYNLAKLYQRINTDFNYYEITNHVSNPIIFTNTGEPVTYSYYTNFIAGYPTREDIITKFTINGREELEKVEQISYGRANKYRIALGFEVLQSYSIINEKVTRNIMENWTNRNSAYLSRFGVMNVYGMHLASLETAWLADEIADSYAKEFNVKWNRGNTATILGGINLEDTYLHILNADMGMSISGNKQNIELFRLINSLNLPNIEDYVLEPVADRFWNNTENSLDNVLKSISENNYSIAQLGEMLYLFCQNDSAIVLNTSSGVSSVILSNENTVYKGSRIHTSEDCCGVGIMPKDIIRGIRDILKIASPATYLLSNHFKDIHPLSLIAYKGLSFLLGKTLSGASASVFGLATGIILLQDGAVKYRDAMISEKDWHSAMDTFTITRPGYIQSKKIYNIPNENGGTDYLEVKINNDLTLDRNNATYISAGKTRKLTSEETYQYFCEDYWTPFSMPTKYWDESWK